MPRYTQNLTIALQNQPWYTRCGPSEFLTRSSNQSKSPQIKQRQKIHFSFQFTSPCSLCKNVGNSYPTPFLRVYVVYLRAYIVQQFTVFTENVEKACLYICQKLVFISCPIQMLLSSVKLYDIRRISG